MGFCLGSRAHEGAKFLMRETVSFGAKTVREAAARASVDVERIGVLASVQPRGFIPGATAQHLGLGRDRAVTTYEEVAHIGGSGLVFNLARGLRDPRPPGPRCDRGCLRARRRVSRRAAAIIEAM